MSTVIISFTKMKLLKIWYEFQYGLNKTTVDNIEKGCKIIDKIGSVDLTMSKEADKPAIPLKSPIPQHSNS